MNRSQRLQDFLRGPLIDPASCPDAERLAEYVLNELVGNEQLLVAAHLRICPGCQLAVQLATPPTTAPFPMRIKSLIAQRVLLPLASGLRSSSAGEPERYQVGDFAILISALQIEGEGWQLSGRLLHNGVGLAGWRVSVSVARRRLRQDSDQDGFFTITGLPAGSCQISLSDGETRVLLRQVALGATPEE